MTISVWVGLLLLLGVMVIAQPLAHKGSSHWDGQPWWQPVPAGSMAGIVAQEPRGQNHRRAKGKRQGEMTEADHQLVFQQTGLGAAAIDRLRRKEKQGFSQQTLAAFQQSFFRRRLILCCRCGTWTKQDRIDEKNSGKTLMVPLEDGDVLLSFSSHSLNWRHGHAGLVVSAEKGQCLEACTLGRVSEIKPVEHWRQYANFLVLRLEEASPAERKQIARYARENLQGVPYSLISGLTGSAGKDWRKTGQRELRAQCAYLIWYAFKRYGYDLDADGGRMVTVQDLSASPHLGVVQIFGLDPQDYQERICTDGR